MRILLVDHHDSYTHILGHLLHCAGQQLGCGVELDIIPHDSPSWQTGRLAEAARYHLIVLSPGPGNPLDAKDIGVSRELLQAPLPVWGVCLGHQLMAVSEGAQLRPDHTPHHGVVSRVRHNGDGIWRGVAPGAQVVRYHSLAVEEPLPAGIEATSWAEDGTVMSLHYQSAGAPRWGVQFHPESIDSSCGVQVAMNVLSLTREWWDAKGGCRSRGVALPAIAGEQIVEVLRAAAQPGESLRWLDDSVGETTSIIALCGEPSGFPEVRPTVPAYPYAGWIGVLDYEQEHANFAHTRVVVWGRGTSWQVAGEDAARVAELRERFCTAATPPTCTVVASPTSATASAELAHVVRAVAISPARYQRSFNICQELLARGESYEMCLTDVLHLPRRLSRSPWQAYLHLRRACPTNFGAFLEFPTGAVEAVVSASPELFVQVSADGTVTTRPMKGTAPRCLENPQEDKRRAYDLQHSPKTRAENLMVIDMARSDVARVCQPGSVTVSRDRVVESYRTVHQLVTEVVGRLAPGYSIGDVVRACFPPASMTGAPKERTVGLLRSIEAEPRGIYSGTIGFLGDDGSASLSVVIRTALYTRAGEVLVGAGGAITADSSCQSEYEELLHKASYVVGAVLDPAQWAPPVVDSFYLLDGRYAQAEGLANTIAAVRRARCDHPAHSTRSQPSASCDHSARGSYRDRPAPGDQSARHQPPTPCASGGAASGEAHVRELHQQRFVSSVRELYGDTAARQAADFYQECLTQLPPTGEFFPQIRWDATGGSAHLTRPCPPRLTDIVGLLGTSSTFIDTYGTLLAPRAKGPDMPAYGELRAAADAQGAQEVVLSDRWGMVREGSHSAILWWDEETLCGPPHGAVMPSTMRTLVEEEARAQGLAVEERWLPMSELPRYHVWSVNALHGVRRITSWVTP